MKYKAYINGQPYRMYSGSDGYSPNIFQKVYTAIEIYINDELLEGVTVTVEGEEYTTDSNGRIRIGVQRELLADNEYVSVTYNGVTISVFINAWIDNGHAFGRAYFSDENIVDIAIQIQYDGEYVGPYQTVTVDDINYSTEQNSFIFVSGVSGSTKTLTVTCHGRTQSLQVTYSSGNTYLINFVAAIDLPENILATQNVAWGTSGSFDVSQYSGTYDVYMYAGSVAYKIPDIEIPLENAGTQVIFLQPLSTGMVYVNYLNTNYDAIPFGVGAYDFASVFEPVSEVTFAIAKSGVEAGSKKWGTGDCGTFNGAVTQSFTVPAGVTKLQVYAKSDTSSSETTKYYSEIKNASNNVVWAEGYANKTPKHLEAVVAVTAGKTYDISMDCYWTSGVTISWSNEINAMAATVADL